MNFEATSKSANHLNVPARSLAAVQLITNGNVNKYAEKCSFVIIIVSILQTRSDSGVFRM